ncbi:MAG: trehalose-phosphatase [Alphaproteobacteria bacterium]|nr:trehalose-phosphatase [Alphaproteobacteria bacterium]
MVPTDRAQDAPYASRSPRDAPASLGAFDGILLDLDGVITETAKTHAQAWKRMFDAFLEERAERLGDAFEPFDLERDYKQFVDGRPRYEGVATFLRSRGISLPPGDQTDAPDRQTVCGLGNRKNQFFLEAIRQYGVEVHPSSIDFIRRAKARGLRIAVVTSSRNGPEVLQAVGIGNLFDAQVDGMVAQKRRLRGKPDPDTYLDAARQLGVAPEKAVVVEDAVSGVQAGKAGGFGLVVGLSRDGRPELLRDNGADLVVSDLNELELPEERAESATIAPLALERLAEIQARIRERRVAVFLDYDGTLTPIVARPELAVLADDMRTTIKGLAECCSVLVVSGRERSDVERLVGLGEVIFAGCHGFDIAGPSGTQIQHEEGAAYVPVVTQAASELRGQLASVEGVIVEHKTYDVAVHYRLASAEGANLAGEIVDRVVAEHPMLRKTRGKKVFELRPNMDWDKGKAVLWLLDALGLDGADVIPFYLGDDETDRDAFEALHGKGISLLVAEQPLLTQADYRLTDTEEVRVFLTELTHMLSERTG